MGALRRAAIALALIWAAVFLPQLTQGKVFILGDARIYRPFAEFSRQRWHESHVRTFWNPYVLDGVPATTSLADMRPQYLPGPVLDVAETMRPGAIVPLATPLLALLAGMIAIAAIAWMLWGLPAVALTWAGVAYGLTPIVLVPFAFGHDAFFSACALMPIALLALLALFSATGAWAVAAATLALAMTVGVQALTGHPQVVVYSGGLLVAFAIERAIRLRRPARLAAAFAAIAWGAAISAAVWLPALEYGRFSSRGGAGVSVAEAKGLSLAWYELVTLVWPQAVGGANNTYWGGLVTTDYPRFIGTLVGGFALLAAFAPKSRRPRETMFLVGLVVVSLALALGPRFEVLYSMVVRRLPFFDKFRVSSMGLIVTALAAALLSATAFGPAGAGRVAPGPRRRGLIVAGAVIGVTAVALGVMLASGRFDDAYSALATRARPDRGMTEDYVFAAHAAGFDLAWRVPLLLAGLALLAWRRTRPAAGVALVALLLLDLAPVSRPILARGTGTASQLQHRRAPQLALIGAARPATRVLSLRGIDASEYQTYTTSLSPEERSNDWIRWRAHAYGGEHGTPPRSWRGLDFLANADALRAFGVTYVSTRSRSIVDTTGLVRVATGDDEIVYRYPNALGRAYAVRHVIAVGSDSVAVARMLSIEYSPGREAFTSDREAAGDYPGSDSLALRWLRDEPDTLALELRSPARAFVVVADTWFPGWTARLDGLEVPIRNVNAGLRGCEIPAGRHTLAMTFVPDGWARALPVTRAALGLWALAAVAVAAGLARPRRAYGARTGETGATSNTAAVT